MKAIAALAAAFLCVSAAPLTPGYNTPHSFAMPPERFQGDGAAVVVFVSDVSPYCGTAEPGYTRVACAGMKDGVPIIIMPNPAPFAEQGDVFALIAAHELAHVGGWGPNHED